MSDEIEQIDSNNAVAIFTGGLDDILTKIASDLKDFTPDISTEKGRKEIKSRAYKASQCKTKLDEMGKKLNEDAMNHIKAVNADRNRAVAFLDGLRDEIRKPVDDYEMAEELRIAAHEAAIVNLSAWGVHGQLSSDQIKDRMDSLDSDWKCRDWEEFALRAENVGLETAEKLTASYEAAKKYEAEQAELEAFRAEKTKRDAEEADRQRQAHEAKIAADAAEKARREAEERAHAILAAAKAEEERQRQEAAASEERAKKAEADAKAAAERAEADRVAEAERAAAAMVAAIEKAERDQAAAIETERKRAADAKAAEDAATAKRESDKAHRAKINNEALQALAALDCVLGEIPAKAIVIAIAEGKIPHVFVRY